MRAPSLLFSWFLVPMSVCATNPTGGVLMWADESSEPPVVVDWMWADSNAACCNSDSLVVRSAKASIRFWLTRNSTLFKIQGEFIDSFYLAARLYMGGTTLEDPTNLTIDHVTIGCVTNVAYERVSRTVRLELNRHTDGERCGGR